MIRYEYSTFVENMHIMIGMTGKGNGRVHLEKKKKHKEESFGNTITKNHIY